VKPVLVLLDDPSWGGERLAGERTSELLACLLLSGPAGAGNAEIIGDLWPDSAPAHSLKALQVVVSRARKATLPGLVESTGIGYRLGPGPVDALALDQHATEATDAWGSGLIVSAISSARLALSVPILSDGGEGPLARVREKARRTQARMRRLLALALAADGQHSEALPELEHACSVDPADEELLAALLLTEAAVRGAPSALRRFEGIRVELAGGLGVDPGETLRRAHAQLLASDRPQRDGVRLDSDDLVGRDGDLRALRGLLARHRVVTILGPGGLGKTRMAHLIARDAPEPVVQFVELVGVRTGDDVMAEVGSALNVRDSVVAHGPLTPAERADLRTRIARYLDRAPTLLVLDNCEQVIGDVAALVGFLTGATRGLRILTTSRAPLSIGAEQVFPLRQLDLDQAQGLFCQRASAIRPSTELNAADVKRLVARLDGLPLAIELAAAMTRVMSVSEISRRLDARLEVLRSADRAAPDRHRTLMAVIDWSWNLLDERGQIALRRLAVFGDGFTLDASEAILGRRAREDVRALVEQSLLSVAEEHGRTRLRMLETVREFGLAKLAEAGEEEVAAGALRGWAASMANTARPLLFSERQAEAIAGLTAEETNLSEVLRAALSGRDQETAIRVGAVLCHLWVIRGEADRLLSFAPAVDSALADYRPTPSRIDLDDATRLAAVVITTLDMFIDNGVTARAWGVLDRMGPGTSPFLAASVRVMGAMADRDDVHALERLAALAGSSDRLTRLLALQWGARIEENLGAADTAREHIASALDLWRPEDGSWTRATLELNLAQLAAAAGDLVTAARHARQVLPELVLLGADDDVSDARSLLAVEAIRRGDLDAAETLIPPELVDRDGREVLLGNLTNLAARAELELARGDVREGLDTYRRLARLMSGPIPGLGIVLEVFAVFGLAGATAAHALHGTGDDLLAELASRLPMALAEGRRIDYPVVGAGLFAFALAGLVLDRVDSDEAALALAIAHRFNYVRFLPSLDWQPAADLIEQRRPGALAAAESGIGVRKGSDLLAAARALRFTLL